MRHALLFVISLAAISLHALEPDGAPRNTLPPVSATISLPRETVLPGVPFDIVVTLTNRDVRPRVVGLMARIIVTLADGTVHAPADYCLLSPREYSTPYESAVEIGPGESIEKVASWDLGRTPGWARDSTFSGPGVYNIAFQIETPTPDLGAEYVGPVHSNSVRLTRQIDPGEDEDLWQRMQSVAGGRWPDNGFRTLTSGQALAEEITRLHPNSAYYPYALLLHTPYKTKDDIERLLDAAKRFEHSPALPYLLKSAADAALTEALTSQRRGEPQAAAMYRAQAERHYREALATGNVGVREGAEQGLSRAAFDRTRLRQQ